MGGPVCGGSDFQHFAGDLQDTARGRHSAAFLGAVGGGTSIGVGIGAGMAGSGGTYASGTYASGDGRIVSCALASGTGSYGRPHEGGVGGCACGAGYGLGTEGYAESGFISLAACSNYGAPASATGRLPTAPGGNQWPGGSGACGFGAGDTTFAPRTNVAGCQHLATFAASNISSSGEKATAGNGSGIGNPNGMCCYTDAVASLTASSATGNFDGLKDAIIGNPSTTDASPSNSHGTPSVAPISLPTEATLAGTASCALPLSDVLASLGLDETGPPALPLPLPLPSSLPGPILSSSAVEATSLPSTVLLQAAGPGLALPPSACAAVLPPSNLPLPTTMPPPVLHTAALASCDPATLLGDADLLSPAMLNDQQSTLSHPPASGGSAEPCGGKLAADPGGVFPLQLPAALSLRPGGGVAPLPQLAAPAAPRLQLPPPISVDQIRQVASGFSLPLQTPAVSVANTDDTAPAADGSAEAIQATCRAASAAAKAHAGVAPTSATAMSSALGTQSCGSSAGIASGGTGRGGCAASDKAGDRRGRGGRGGGKSSSSPGVGKMRDQVHGSQAGKGGKSGVKGRGNSGGGGSGGGGRGTGSRPSDGKNAVT